MKFLHTADWQIGMKAEHVGGAGQQVRKQRLESIQKVIKVAKSNEADFILIAGDTFEDNGVDRTLVQIVADALGGTELPVFVIPGNHDPFGPGSVWEHPAWKSAENVHVLIEHEPVEVAGGCVLYPCPAREKHSRKDPTAWISTGDDEAVRIGVAHGTVEGVHQQEPEYPIPRNAAERTGLDYLALGHWHSTATYPVSDGSVRMAYSGTHEETGFGERDSGNVLIVDIQSPRATPVVTPTRTGALRWQILDSEIRQSGDLPKLREQIEAVEDPATTLLQVRVTGLMAADDREELSRIQDILETRFLYGRMDAAQARPSPEDNAWVSSLPPGIVRDAASRLVNLADPNFSGTRPDGARPEVASRALLELYALLTEVPE